MTEVVVKDINDEESKGETSTETIEQETPEAEEEEEEEEEKKTEELIIKLSQINRNKCQSIPASISINSY